MQELLADFERWGFDQRGYARRTRVHYRQRAAAADLWLAANREVRVTRATLADVQAYNTSTPPTARNRNTIRQALAAWFDFLIHAGHRDDNPALGLPRLPEHRSVPKALSDDQASAVLHAARVYHPMWHAVVAAMLFAGLRREEARTLEWVDIEADEWLRFHAKGSDERIVPLHPAVQQALTAWRGQCPSPRWVVPSPDPSTLGPIGPSAVNDHIRRIGEDAGLAGLHPHVLRHTYATGLIQRGADLATVQHALGHSQLSSTQMYLRVRPTRVAEAVASLDW